MRIIIFGATGRTGHIISRLAISHGHELITPSRQACDLADSTALARTIFAADAQVVINAAAVSSLEACLDNPLQAHLVNAVAPGTMALACRHTGAKFIHLSTDYVLDGRRPGLKDEGSKCRPVNVYGESKREGELQVAENNPESLILRVSWIMGNPQHPSFVEQALRRALRGEPLAAIADKWSMPTDAEDIARAALDLAEAPVSGILHLCSGGEPQSWHSCAEYALRVAQRHGALANVPAIRAQKLAEAAFFRDPRPRHTAMGNAKLLAAGIPMPTAEETLQRVTLRFLSHARNANP